MEQNKASIFILIIIVIYCFCSCDKLLSDEKLSLQKTTYNSNQLRIDGYYYTQKSDITSIYFLYQDGIYLYAYSHQNMNLFDIEQEMINNNMYNDYKPDKSRWGLFIVNGTNIQIEHWQPSNGGGLPVLKSSGYVENDTTFHITYTYSTETNKEYTGDWIYHFRQFAHKPDSTNNFIK